MGARAAVYVLPDSPGPATASSAAARLDEYLARIARDSGLDLPGLFVYPLYPSTAQFQEDWWRFATLRDGVLHGWGTVYAGDLDTISPYQVARRTTRTRLGIQTALWGLALIPVLLAVLLLAGPPLRSALYDRRERQRRRAAREVRGRA